MRNPFRSILLMFSAVFAFAMLGASALASDNPFATPQASAMKMAAGGKCGAGKCGGAMSSGKCQGAAAASAAPADDASLKALCAEKIRGGFCGAGKCAAGKCGESLKATCARMMEGSGGKCGGKPAGGKCGTGKCGGK